MPDFKHKQGMIHYVPDAAKHGQFVIMIGDEVTQWRATNEDEAIIFCQGFAAGSSYQFHAEPKPVRF